MVRSGYFEIRRADRHAESIYLPYWTFDASAHADWNAMSGDYYTRQNPIQTRRASVRPGKCSMYAGIRAPETLIIFLMTISYREPSAYAWIS